MVTSYEMSENEMGYRGSKSEIISFNPQPSLPLCPVLKQGIKILSVKEQRVDGSYFGISPKLRCTLMGGESRYQLKIPSKQFNMSTFSTLAVLTQPDMQQLSNINKKNQKHRLLNTHIGSSDLFNNSCTLNP